MAVKLKSRGFCANELTIDALLPMQLITVGGGNTIYVVLGVDDGPNAILYNVDQNTINLFHPDYKFWEAPTGTEVTITQE